MSKMIAFCGIDCAKCPARIAMKNNDQQLRQQTAQEWSKMFEHDFKPEEINCVGCRVMEGVHVGYCSMCEIRACGIEKKLETCAHCDEFACARLEKFLSNVPAGARENLVEIRKTLKN